MFHNVRSAVLAFLVALLGTVSSPARGEDRARSNFDVMDKLASEVCAELVSKMPADLPSREIRLAPFGTDGRYELIANAFTRSLGEKGYRAYMPVPQAKADSSAASHARPDSVSAAGGDAGLRLEFETIAFTLRYPEIYRSYLVGGKNVKRAAELRVLAKLVEPQDGLVVWMSEASKSYGDQFPYDDIEDVEASLYDFTKPPRETRNWGKIVEPVVVSGIIVGLIYLFFSNQGD
jgi:hypothetical protein